MKRDIKEPFRQEEGYNPQDLVQGTSGLNLVESDGSLIVLKEGHASRLNISAKNNSLSPWQP